MKPGAALPLLVLSLLAGCECSTPDVRLLRFKCSSQADCLDDHVCADSVCVPLDAGSADAGTKDAGTDAGFDAGADDAGIDGGIDAGAPRGTPCNVGPECASGICSDAVCCNDACGGPCDRCDSTGTCVLAPTTPDGGSPCGAFRCVADAGSCQSSCVTAMTCAASAVCLSTQCLFPKANGSTCAVGAECTSGLCVDGYCCNATCGAACNACNVAGSLGTCAFSPAGTSCGVYACSGTSSTCPTSCTNDNGCTAPNSCAWFGDCIPRIGTFKEDFNDNVLDSGVWDFYQGGGAKVFERNQQLEVTLAALDSGYAGIYSRFPRFGNLIGSSCTFELRSVPPPLDAAETYLALEGQNGSQNSVFFNLNQNVLTAYVRADGGQTFLASLPYTTARMRYLRLREDAGTVYWEYSDGGAYQVMASRPNPFRLNGVGISIGAGTYSPEDAGGLTVFDNINVNVP